MPDRHRAGRETEEILMQMTRRTLLSRASIAAAGAIAE
jgi:hypothetical protein